MAHIADQLSPRAARSDERAFARASSAPGGRSRFIPSLLSVVWPGLGHAALRRWRRAAAFAIPPALLLIGAVALALSDPAAAAVALLNPGAAIAVLGLIALHAAWRVAAIADVWRSLRTSGTTRAPGALAVALAALVLGVHLAAASVVQSFAGAGAQIFQGDRPTGGAAIDDILGGGPVGGGPSGNGDRSGNDRPGNGDRPGNVGVPPAGAPSPTVPTMTDTNGDGVVDWNDDGWIEDDPSDGWEEPPVDVDTPGEPTPPANPATPGEPTMRPPPLSGPAIPRPTGDGPVNVLFVGLDSGLGRTHSLSDTLILASWFPAHDRLTMISIPRDTGHLPLYTGGMYPRRINTFLSYARANPHLFPEGPIAALMREVGYVLGTDVHYYAATDLDGLPRLIDLVGGVDVLLDRPIADDRWGLYLEPGMHHLDGHSVMPYVRSRYGPGNSDWQRARRQQQVIRAAAARIRDPGVALRLPQIVDGMSAVVRTNVPRSEVGTLMRMLERANGAAVENIVLSPNSYARRIPVSETGGRYMTELLMPRIRDLSLRVFGAHSRYR